jgi:hypothetical protein
MKLPSCTWAELMAETSTILASLDLFIERFKTWDEIGCRYAVSTGQRAPAKANHIENHDIGHLDHFSHSGRDTHADDSLRHTRRDDARPVDVVGARKASSTHGHSGNSGQNLGNRGLDSGRYRNGVGHSSPEHQPQIGFNPAEISEAADPYRSAFKFWRGIYQERAARPEHDGGYQRLEAELLAWRELESRWHMAHCQPAAAGICAGCQRPIGNEDVIDDLPALFGMVSAGAVRRRER